MPSAPIGSEWESLAIGLLVRPVVLAMVMTFVSLNWEEPGDREENIQVGFGHVRTLPARDPGLVAPRTLPPMRDGSRTGGVHRARTGTVTRAGSSPGTDG